METFSIMQAKKAAREGNLQKAMEQAKNSSRCITIGIVVAAVPTILIAAAGVICLILFTVYCCCLICIAASSTH